MFGAAVFQVRLLIERVSALGRHTMVALTLSLLLFVAALFVRSYFGSGYSPYGTCYATTGRAVPCKAIGR